MFLSLLVASAWGQVSVLDESFQVGTGADGPVNAMILLRDQHILVGGEFTSINGQPTGCLARLRPDGSVDSDFSAAGQADGAVWCMVQAPDGGVLVGGAFRQLLGVERYGLAKLAPDGSVDITFDACDAVPDGGCVYSVALQKDGGILVGYQIPAFDILSRISRLKANGVPDPGWTGTDVFRAFPMALLPMPDGGVLVGANPVTNTPVLSLFRLQQDGAVDATFYSALELSTVFRLVRTSDDSILVAGLLKRLGAQETVPLLRLTSDLIWDDSFHPAVFGGTTALHRPYISELVLEPDRRIVAGGYFFEVGGYARRQIVRLTPEGGVDGCFDPGMGLSSPEVSGPARAMILQTDGRILVGGSFSSVDTAWQQRNIARLLSGSACEQIRTYLVPVSGVPGSLIITATLPPGGINVLEESENLRDWQEVERSANPYLFHSLEIPVAAPSAKFFRACKIHSEF